MFLMRFRMVQAPTVARTIFVTSTFRDRLCQKMTII